MSSSDIRIPVLLLLATFGCGSLRAQPSASPDPLPIIPAPADVRRGVGGFTVTRETPVRFGPGPAEAAARYLIDLLERTPGLSLTTRPGTRGSGIIFEPPAGAGALPAGDEAYTLTVTPEVIRVSSAGSAGLFYGAVSVWQLLSADPGAERVFVPSVAIHDRPRFRWRGLMLDSARHYQSPAFIERFIDLMALHKLNVLHWHLTDDQAWRLEIERYPELTAVGAWRVPAGPAAAADIDPATGRPRLYGGFYRQDEVRDIVAHAAARHVTIVPEIEMPGHASAALAAYPELAVDGSSPGSVPADWGIYDNLFNVREPTFEFLENVLAEVIALFPGTYVHVGGDEAVKDQWRQSASVQSRMRELGIADEAALQGYFVRRIGAWLDAHGRRLIGWDEILDGAAPEEDGLPPGATVMSWRGVDGAVAAARAGHDAVLSPAPTLYFDHRPLDTAMPGRGSVVALEDVYRFDPAPGSLGPAERRHILGVQANIWTEHIRTEARVLEMTFPRAAALAEIAWSPADRTGWASFAARLPAQLSRYRALGVGYAQRDEGAEPSRRRRTSHELALCTNALVLSLEDDSPVAGPRATYLVDIMNPCWIYRDADLTPGTRISASVGQVPFNFRIGDDVERIVLPAPRTPAGELEVRLDDCSGETVAVLPLAPAVGRAEPTLLPPAALTGPGGRHDLCLEFTRRAVDPMWVLDAVTLCAPEQHAAAQLPDPTGAEPPAAREHACRS